MQIIPQNTAADRISTSLAGGLESGLKALAEHKINQINQQKQTALFNKAGFNPETSALLADLQRRSPEHFHQVLGMLGGNQQQPGGQSASFAQQLSQGKANEKDEFKRQLNAQKLAGNVENFRDIKDIVGRMKDLLATGKVNVGLIPGAKSKYLGPNWNNTETEDYEKLSNELLVLTSDAAKGVQNIFRTRLRQNAKPGLQHSIAVNDRILDDINNRVSEKESTFFKMNPDLRQYFEDQQPQQQSHGQVGTEENPQLEQDDEGNLYLNGKLLKKRGG